MLKRQETREVRGDASSLQQASFELIASRPARAVEGKPSNRLKYGVYMSLIWARSRGIKLGFAYELFKVTGLEIVTPEQGVEYTAGVVTFARAVEIFIILLHTP
jgi:hypothetical protein